MDNEQAIFIVQQQIEEAKRWLHLLRDKQSSESFIHALELVLELAKKQVEEYDDEEYGYFNMKLSREYGQFIGESEELEE